MMRAVMGTDRKSDLLRAVKATFPQMPAPVIQAWLGGPYRELGWPPDGSSAWHEVLLLRAAKWWADVVWAKRLVDADMIVLDGPGDDAVRARIYARYSDLGGSNSCPRWSRFDRALREIRECGTIGAPLVLLQRRDEAELCAGLDELAALHSKFALSGAGHWPTVTVWVGTYDKASSHRWG